MIKKEQLKDGGSWCWKEDTITALLQGPSLPVEEIAAVMRVEIEEVLRIKNSLAIA